MGDIGTSGYIRIPSEQDRIAIAAILFKHGYSVSTKRIKNEGKAYTYYLRYTKEPSDIREDNVPDES